MLLSVRLLGSRCHVSNLNHNHGRGRGHVCLFSSLTFSRGSRLVPSVRPSIGCSIFRSVHFRQYPWTRCLNVSGDDLPAAELAGMIQMPRGDD